MTFIRYVFIQVVAYILDMSFFMFQIKWSVAGVLVANINAKIFAGIFAFFMHGKYTFQTTSAGSREAQAIKYFLLLVVNIPFSSAVLALNLLWVYRPEVAKLLSDLFCLLLTYIVSKKLVFTQAKSNGGSATSSSKSCIF